MPLWNARGRARVIGNDANQETHAQSGVFFNFGTDTVGFTDLFQMAEDDNVTMTFGTDTIGFSDVFNMLAGNLLGSQSGVADVILLSVFLDSATQRYAGRFVRHPLWVYDGRLVTAGTISRSIAMPSGLPVVSDGTIDLADEDNSIRNLFDSEVGIRRLLEIRMGPENTSIELFGVPYFGEVQRPTAHHGIVRLAVKDITFAWMNESIPPLGTLENFPNMDEGGFFIPIITGDVSTSHDDPVTRGAIELKLIDSLLFRYAVARHPIQSVILYRQLPGEETWTAVSGSEYILFNEDKLIDGVTYNMSYIQFFSAQAEGTRLRANVKGMNQRAEWGSLSAIEDALITNVVDFLINLLTDPAMNGPEQDVARYDTAAFATARTNFESLGYVCAGAITEPTTYGTALAQVSKSFNMDFYQNRLAQIAIALTGDPPAAADRFHMDDTLHMLEGTVDQTWPDTTFNRIRYSFSKHYGDNKFHDEEVYNNTADQAALARPGETIKVQEEVVEFHYVRDATTALAVAKERAGFFTLASYDLTCEVPAPVVQHDLDLAQFVSITHYAGMPSGGWDEEPFKVVGIDFDVGRLVYKLHLRRRVDLG